MFGSWIAYRQKKHTSYFHPIRFVHSHHPHTTIQPKGNIQRSVLLMFTTSQLHENRRECCLAFDRQLNWKTNNRVLNKRRKVEQQHMSCWSLNECCCYNTMSVIAFRHHIFSSDLLCWPKHISCKVFRRCIGTKRYKKQLTLGNLKTKPARRAWKSDVIASLDNFEVVWNRCSNPVISEVALYLDMH